MATIVFILLAKNHIFATASAGLADDYVYFDVNVEPGYVAMYKGDLPGPVPIWPPPGELGGVGLFTVLLTVGLGAAIALGAGRTMVIVITSVTAGCWVMRFWYAHLLFKTKLVQLYPRTTAEILYCSIALVGVALYLGATRTLRIAPESSPLRSRWVPVGAVCALLMLLGSAGTSMCDHYMPNNVYPYGAGLLTWWSHHMEGAPNWEFSPKPVR